MDNYNSDLILDLAAGLLPGHEARAAEAALSAEGRVELQAQRAALAAIAAAPPVGMTDIERAHLHRSVASRIVETTREPSPARVAAPAPTRKRRSVLLMRWASAATVAAMFVGVVAVGSQLSSSSDSGDAAPAAGEARTESTAATAGDEEAFRDLISTTADLFASDGATGGGAGAPNDSAAESDARFLLEAPPLEQAPADSNLEALTDFVTEAIDARRIPVAGVTTLPCYAVAAEDDDLDIVRGFLVPYPAPNGQEVNAIAFSDAGTSTVDPLIRIYDQDTCEALAVND